MVMPLRIVFLSCYLLIFFLSTFGQNELAGRYEDQFNKMELKCNGSFISNFCNLNDTVLIFGRWSKVKNNVHLALDSSSPKNFKEQKQVLILNVKDSFLYPSKVTRSEYRKVKHAAKNEYHPRRVEPYSEYKKSNLRKLKKVTSLQCT